MQELYTCQVPVLVSTTAIACQLPYLAPLEDESVLPVRVRLGSISSKWMLGVHYSHGRSCTTHAPPTTRSRSESYRSAFIACVVLLTVPSFVLMALVCRRYQRLTPGMPKLSSILCKKEDSTYLAYG